TNAVKTAICWLDKVKDFAIGGAGDFLKDEAAKMAAAKGVQIPHNALGNKNFQGGLTWLAENGPELVWLPRGSQIFNAGQTQRMLRPQNGIQPQFVQGGGGQGQNIGMYIANATFEDHVDVKAAQAATNAR